MTTCLGKSCSFCLPRVPFVNCCQFMYLVISLLVLRAECGIWLYQFLIIAYLFTLLHLNVSIFFLIFRRLPEWKKIHCNVVLLRSRISTVSRTVKRQSVSIPSLTSVNALSSVRVGLPTFFVETLLSLNRICHLLTKALEILGRQYDESRNFLVYTGIFRPLWKFNKETLLRLNLWRRHLFRLFMHCIYQQNIIPLISESRGRSNFLQVTFNVFLTSVFNFTMFSLLWFDNIERKI